jgi:hypothetical protein
MDFRNVHHLREILITDMQGTTTSAMQYSTQQISRFRPSFSPVPFNDQKLARELYLRLGGKRREGAKIGVEVILDFTELDEISSPPQPPALITLHKNAARSVSTLNTTNS